MGLLQKEKKKYKHYPTVALRGMLHSTLYLAKPSAKPHEYLHVKSTLEKKKKVL